MSCDGANVPNAADAMTESMSMMKPMFSHAH